jgi:hypothetical protein
LTISQLFVLFAFFAVKISSSDQRALKEFLGSPAVENFYGFAHAGMNIFAGISGSDLEHYIGPKRFRFAFLDGCNSGLRSHHLIRRFGAAGLELGRGRTIDDLRTAQPQGPLQGPVLIGEYAEPTAASPNNLGIRPAAFLGWRYSPPIGHWYYPPQPEYGNWKGRLDPAHAHWEQLIVYYWRDLDRNLIDALEIAGHEAVDPGAWPPWEMNFPVIEWPDGSEELHYPNSGLLIFGYGELGFMQFNESGDTW